MEGTHRGFPSTDDNSQVCIDHNAHLRNHSVNKHSCLQKIDSIRCIKFCLQICLIPILDLSSVLLILTENIFAVTLTCFFPLIQLKNKFLFEIFRILNLRKSILNYWKPAYILV